MFASTDPVISVIIPARNEEQHLPKCLESLRLAASTIDLPIEVIVVLNRCTDGTEFVARYAGCRIQHNDSKNLSRIRNAGAALATGEILVTIDADSTVSPNMFKAVVRALSRGDVVGGGVLIRTERVSVGILITGLFLLPLLLRRGVSAGLFYCKRADFEAIGGFDERLVSIEDIDFAERLKLHGARTGRRFKTLWNAYVRTSCRKFDLFGDWYLLRNRTFRRSITCGTNEAAANAYWYDVER
jgi:glycosyltransferase involved in cell wall biosynthesis